MQGNDFEECWEEEVWAVWVMFFGLFLAAACRDWDGVWPVGLQCFKFAKLAFFPFGKEIVYGGGVGSFLLNIIWLVVSGIWLALGSVVTGCLLCITVIGIPFGLQHFKLAKLALMPFGSDVV